jgi:hypothetical protein
MVHNDFLQYLVLESISFTLIINPYSDGCNSSNSGTALLNEIAPKKKKGIKTKLEEASYLANFLENSHEIRQEIMHPIKIVKFSIGKNFTATIPPINKEVM